MFWEQTVLREAGGLGLKRKYWMSTFRSMAAMSTSCRRGAPEFTAGQWRSGRRRYQNTKPKTSVYYSTEVLYQFQRPAGPAERRVFVASKT